VARQQLPGAAGSPGLSADGGSWWSDFREIRTDRVLAFKDQVYSGSQKFEYYCRAVCEGKFVAPATRVAAMYSPGVNGYSPKGELTVKGR